MKRGIMVVLAMGLFGAAGTVAAVKSLPKRAEVKVEDTWDLTKLFKSDQEWEETFKKWESQISGYEQFRGKLGEGAKTLAVCLKFDAEFSRAGEKLDSYAHLKVAQDQGNSEYQRMRGRLAAAGTKAAEAFSWFAPELMSIPADQMEKMLGAAELAEWRVALERVLRFRAHTLGKGEEQLLAMQGDMSETAVLAFRQLNDADLKWGTVANEKGELVELGTATWPMFLECPKRSVRQEAFVKFYEQYDWHKNTLAATLNGGVQKDVYYAKARKYNSALEAALFPDNVPAAVYDSLIEAVHKRLPALHRYYALRKRAMKLDELHIYDTYIPILSEIEKKHTWEQGVKVVVEALRPMGDEYCGALEKGLTVERWSDRYPNAGKQSGAFSSGGYDGPPYMLMNYQDTVLDHVFTLAHEGGHSMHTYYSARNQPYQYYGYSLFVAEVASTFNEMLLAQHLMKNAKDKQERAYLINRMLDDMRGTIYRQTMFAEFEKITHGLVEKGEPLTVETLRREYRKLLEQYFGPAFVIDEQLSLECMRIPHFYRDFYVYKYATGMSAAIALSERVLKGGEKERQEYLNFLKGGSSKFPLDLLRGAGVDMEKPGAVDAALRKFEELVVELEGLL
ncbi:MAG: oligoendopeptidase F [Planctomycetota bacterium]|nr:oligoendopeptidase F [Planctomycetota bacterium]